MASPNLLRFSDAPSTGAYAILMDSGILEAVGTQDGPGLVLTPPWASGVLLRVRNLSSSGAGTVSIHCRASNADLSFDAAWSAASGTAAVGASVSQILFPVGVAAVATALISVAASTIQIPLPVLWRPRVTVAVATTRYRVDMLFLRGN